MCDDPSGFSRSPERPYLHYVVMPSPIGLRPTSCRQQQVRLLVSLAPDHDGPGHPCDLVGERDGRHFRGSALHQPAKPRPLLGAVPARVADDGHCPDDQQPPQISIALLGDAAEPVLAAGGVLLRHQPDPGRKTAPGGESLPVADLGNQCGSGDRADAWDLRQPPARLTPAMQGHDAPVDGCDLDSDRVILPRQHIENVAHGRRHAAIRTIGNDPQQLRRSITALGRHDAEFGQVPAEGIAQHRTLAHQQLPGPVQHQGGLLLLGLDRDEPHRRPRDRLADRCRIIRVVLAAFEIGLHITWRDQPNHVTKQLQLAAPVMRGRTRFDPDQAGWQLAKILQNPCSTDALADHNRARIIDPVHLEYRLPNIQTNRANLAHGRLPSMWFALTQPPYGTSMPQSGRRPQHHLQTFGKPNRMSALPPKADIRDTRRHVRFGPKGDIPPTYSITSPARASTDCGTLRPSVLAVFRLTTSSYLVGACTGRSAVSPLRMRSHNRREADI